MRAQRSANMKKPNPKLPGLPPGAMIPKQPRLTLPVHDTSVVKSGRFQEGSAKSISFGRASRAATTSPQSNSAWSSLLSGTASGGLTGTLMNVTGFGGGIGSLISGLTSLFAGGKTTPPALTAYQLPTSQQQTISIGSSVESPGVSGSSSNVTAFTEERSGVVQTVKQALLNSSSLNDIIAEL
jgi:predicted lipid-binding transport protein (Tim44 family)